ncbi:iron uptake porin [Geitlerinema sp. PCC 9228]|jgi:hypothetical protein|uniref:iron uptake porin n=1 Tax=Geitlerinema sp. PCC 9228 TaxID=111611 RepID=UPI0008F9BC99|nr:iron uptake porin [Geitlerinema sp. PCC 9228]
MFKTALVVPLTVTTLLASLPGNSAASPKKLDQVTSVSQLEDVRPTDWAFQALQSLVERYGCVAGYPDGTFRGNRTLTRYEFAAGLNACMEVITQLLQENTDAVDQEDLATLQRLQREFDRELLSLRGRVRSLQSRMAELEANQFSPTTKLSGEAIFALTDSFGGDADTQTVFQGRVRLNFNTSFTGRDLLVTRLQAGNSGSLGLTNTNSGISFSHPTGEDVQASQVFGDTDNTFVLDTFAYMFPLGEKISVTLAANAGIFDDFTPTLNPYFEDFDGGDGALSAFAQRNPIYRLGGGAGLGVKFRPSHQWEFTAGYLAANASDSGQGSGLFNGDQATLAQVTFRPSDRLGVALTYNHAYFSEGNFGFDNGGATGTGFTGTTLANQIGATNAIDSDSVGLQFAWRVAPQIQLNGWAGYTNVELLDSDIDGDIWNGALALAFPNVPIPGNVAGLVVGVQPYLSDLEGLNDVFADDPPFHVEGFYKLKISENLSVTPGFIWLTSPNQDSENDDAVIGTLRTTFRF